MRILVDADACPVVKIIEEVASKYELSVLLFYDTSHNTNSDYSQIITVSKGPDSVDFELINRLEKDDIVVTQDYGLAAMSLTKTKFVINQNGFLYNEKNIDGMLFNRHLGAKARKSGKSHFKGPKKRTIEDDNNFRNSFELLIKRMF